MKTSPKTITPGFMRAGRCVLALLICAVCIVQAVAQSDPIQTGLARLARARVDEAAGKTGGVPPDEADFKTPQVKFPRKWNEDRALLRLAVENPETTELKIEGVQTSPSLFVVSFPTVIKPGARGELVLRYAGRPGVNGDTDLVRLLTNQGEKAIEVMQEREQVFTLDKPSMAWNVGEPVTPKTVTLAILRDGIRPKAVRVFGEAKPKAEIRDLGAGRYAIDITPASTAKAGRFAVMVELDPQVTGSLPMIQCAVASVD